VAEETVDDKLPETPVREGGGTTVPIRSRLAWLLLSVPAALVACVASVTKTERSPAGHYVGGLLYLLWAVLLVGTCWWFRRTRTPAVVLDDHGVRFPIVRIMVPWADLASATLRHKGQQLVLVLRDGGGQRLPRPGRTLPPSKTRLRNATLKLPHLLIGWPLDELATAVEGRGVPVERPPFHLRTTQLERVAFGELLVLLLLSAQKGHHTYQTVYFWSAFAILALSFLDRLSVRGAMAVVIAANVLVMVFVLLVSGPPYPTRAAALFTLTLSIASVLAAVNWPPTSKRSPADP
jgi:hypothetical protein